MARPDDIRSIAMGLEGVSEAEHWGRPSWRTARRIFAVLRPDGLFLHLPGERKEFLFAADPAVFVEYMWGKTANVIVQYQHVNKTELAALITEAWAFNRPATKPARRAKQTSSPAAPAETSKNTPSKPRKGAVAVAAIRALCLAMPGAEEKSHFGAPSWRFGGKIFAQTTADGAAMILKLSPACEEIWLRTRPDLALREIWGNIRRVRIALAGLTRSELESLLADAYAMIANPPKKTR